MDDDIKRLEWLLAKIQLLDPPVRGSAEGKDLYQEICKLVFEDQLYIRLWSEPTLNQLEHLLQTEKPDEELFQSELDEICKRTRIVKEVNDFFFAIVDPNTTSETLCKLLAKFEGLPQDFDKRLESSGRLQEIRIQDMSISAKVELFLEFLRDDLSIDLTDKEMKRPKRGKAQKGSSPLFAVCQCFFNPPNSSVKLFLFRYSLLHQQIGRAHR